MHMEGNDIARFEKRRGGASEKNFTVTDTFNTVGAAVQAFTKKDSSSSIEVGNLLTLLQTIYIQCSSLEYFSSL